MYLQLTFIRNETIIVLRVTALFDQDVHLLPLQLLSWDIIQSINTLVIGDVSIRQVEICQQFQRFEMFIAAPHAHTQHLMSTFWTLLDDCQPSPRSRTNILILMPSSFWKKVPHLVFSLQYWQNPSPPKKLKYYTKIQMLSLILNLDCIFSKNRMTNTIRIYE